MSEETDPRAAAEPLFREEAVRDYLHGRTEGRLLRISPSWVGWVVWVFLATAVVGAIFVTTVQVDQYVSGPAVVRALPAPTSGAREVVALLPASAYRLVTVAAPMRVRLDGADAGLDLHVDAILPEIMSPARARMLLGDDLPQAISTPATIVRAALPGDAAVPGTPGTAEVRVGRHTLLRALLPGSGS